MVFLMADSLSLRDGQFDVEVINIINTLNHSNCLYQNYISNDLFDEMYNTLNFIKSIMKLWKSLD